MNRLLIYHALMYGICGYALFRGRADARMVAAIFLVGNFATSGLRTQFGGGYSSLEAGVLAVDILAFLAFTYVALISDRFWPMWVSGLQLTTSLGHVLKVIDPHLLPLAYAAALRFWSYPILVILGVGVWRSQQRARRESTPRPA